MLNLKNCLDKSRELDETRELDKTYLGFEGNWNWKNNYS